MAIAEGERIYDGLVGLRRLRMTRRDGLPVSGRVCYAERRGTRKGARMEIIEGMIRDSGVLNFEFRDLEWATEWRSQIRSSGGKFSGASWGPDTSSSDPSSAAFFVYHPNGGYFEGGDDTLAKLALDIRREFDVE